MCNRYGLTTPISEITAILAGAELPIVEPAPYELPNMQAREHIRPTNRAPILRPVEGGLELVELRWGLIPWFYKGHVSEFKGLNTNARAETAATLASFKGPFARQRCLLPASHFFEWTGPTGSKVMWRFTRAGAELFGFAGLWEQAMTAGRPTESFTMLTSAPGLDAANYHDRQPVILEPANWSYWLDPSQPTDQLVKPPEAQGHLIGKRESDLLER